MQGGIVARNGGRVGLLALVAVLALGLGLRVGYAWDGRAPVYDARAYAAIAANLERGEGFTVGPGATQPSSNYSPGLPLLVATLYEATGGVHERLARVVLAALASLAVLFAYLIGRRLGEAAGPLARPPRASEAGERGGGGHREDEGLTPERPPRSSVSGDREGARNGTHESAGLASRRAVVAGLLAALAVAVYPAFLEYGGMLMSEPLAATLLSGAVLAMFWARDAEPASPAGGGAGRGGLVRWLLAGALLGALTLVRPEYLAVSILLAIVASLPAWQSFSVHSTEKLCHDASRPARSGRWRGAAARGGLVLAGVVVVVAPWTLRNAVALDRLVPVSTGGGQVLYAGTYLPSDGDPERVGAGVVAEHPEIFEPGDAERLRLEQILARLAAHTYPGTESDRALARMGREQLWDDVSQEPLEYAGFVATKIGRIWSHGPRDVMREPLWEALHWALLALGLLGLGVSLWRRRWQALVIATVFLSITAISALLVASPRRVLVMLPLLAACAGVGAVWGWAQMWKIGPRVSQKRSPYSPAST